MHYKTTPKIQVPCYTIIMKLKIFSWNVNGLRAGLKKGTFLDFIATHTPDILCLQETKAKRGQVEIDLPDYTEYWHSAKRAGYSGTAIFTKLPTLSNQDNFNFCPQESTDFIQDQYGDLLCEGRLQTLEFKNFYLVNVYTPNSKRDLSRLSLREKIWDPAILHYLQQLEKNKPIIICGDFNAAHTEIDLARPKNNIHNAGFTKEERQGIQNLIDAGFIDTFRTLHPDAQRYTWWSHLGHARENNVGWRIDYFFISKSLLPHLRDAEIYEQIPGSDHCPVSIELEF